MSRTQLRLQQMTGSAVDIKTEVAQYISPVAAASLTGSDLQDLFGALGAAVQRIHGRASNEVFEQTEGRFDTTTVDFNTSTFDVDATGAFTVDAVGTSNVTTNGALTVSGSTALNLASDGGERDLTSRLGAIDLNAGAAITLDAAAASSFTTTAGAISIDGRTGVNIKENGTDVIVVDTDRAVNIGVSGQATTVKGTFNVDEAASFDSTVLISGDLTVLGSATEISSSNTTIKDALIVLNSSSYGDGTPISQDAGLIFAQPDVSRALFVDQSDSLKFKFVTTYSSGSDTSISPVADADVKMGALDASGVTLSDLTANKVVFTNGSKVLTTHADLSYDGAGDLTVGSDITLNSSGHIQASELRIDSANDNINTDATGGLVVTAQHSLTASVGNVFTVDAVGAINLDSDSGDIKLLDGGTEQLAIDMDGTAGEIAIQLKVDSDDLVFKQYDGNEVIRIADDRKLYFFDQGGEHISSNGTDLTLASGNDVKIDLSQATSDSLQLLGNGSNENLVLTPDNGSAQSVVSSSVGDLLLGANANTFLFQGAQQQSDLQISLPASSGDGVQFTTGDGEMIAISGSAGIFFSEDNIVASNYTGTGGFMALGASVAEYNSFVTNFSATTSIIAAINSNASTLAGADKAILKVDAGGSVSSGSQIALNGGHASMSALLSTDGVSVAGVSSPILKVEVYVNGQLLLSGSDANVGSGDADYLFDTDTSVKFGFGLEADDIVQVVRR